jgi:hypothetical protein
MEDKWALTSTRHLSRRRLCVSVKSVKSASKCATLGLKYRNCVKKLLTAAEAWIAEAGRSCNFTVCTGCLDAGGGCELCLRRACRHAADDVAAVARRLAVCPWLELGSAVASLTKGRGDGCIASKRDASLTHSILHGNLVLDLRRKHAQHEVFGCPPRHCADCGRLARGVVGTTCLQRGIGQLKPGLGAAGTADTWSGGVRALYLQLGLPLPGRDDAHVVARACGVRGHTRLTLRRARVLPRGLHVGITRGDLNRVPGGGLLACTR